MIRLEDFKENELKITWKLLYIGFDNNNYALSIEEIVEYAISLLKETTDENVIGLASSEVDEIDNIKQYLKILSQSENSSYDIESRKWRLVYVIKNMPEKETNYITGLTELGDIWAYFDFPDDSPHIFQCKNNTISPQDYYTKENYNQLYRKHLKWIEQEKDQINKND